jgi:hypothetical protein
MRHRIHQDPFGKKLANVTSPVQSQLWHGNMTLYIDQLLLLQKNITTNILMVLDEDEHADQMFFVGLFVIVVVIVFICPAVVYAV